MGRGWMLCLDRWGAINRPRSRTVSVDSGDTEKDNEKVLENLVENLGPLERAKK